MSSVGGMPQILQPAKARRLTMRTSAKIKLGLCGLFSLAVVAMLTAQDTSYDIGVYKKQGGNELVIAAAGTLTVESGGTIAVASGASTTFNDLIVSSHIDMTPTDSVPSGSSEGFMYWDDSENILKVFTAGAYAAIVTGGGSGDNTLDLAYDEGGAGAGKKIDVDSGAVELEVDDTKDNPALHLDCNNVTNDPTALLIENIADAANAITIDIDAQATGRDIEGTGASWHVTGAGVLTAADAQLTTATTSGTATLGDIAFANGGTINNDTNGEIEFQEAAEELSIAFSGNTVTWATDTDIDTWAMGVVDDISGVGTIAFDAAASSISLAADGAGDDLTISTTGAQDTTLALASSGTAANALTIITTAGGIDITNGGAAGGEDTDISVTNASLNLSAAEDVAEAIVINASTGGIDILADGASGKDLDLGCTNGSVNITAGESGADSMVLTSSIGGIQILAAGAAAGEDILMTATGSSVTISSTEVDEAAISITASTNGGGIDIAAQTDIDIVITNGASGEDITLSNTGGSFIVLATESAVDAVKIEASAGGIDILASGAAAGEDIDIVATGSSVNISSTEDDADAITIVTNGGATEKLKLTNTQGTVADAILLTATAGGITLDANGDIECNASLDVDSTIVGDGSSAITGMLRTVIVDVDGGTLTIAQSGSIWYATGAGVINLPEASTAIGMWFTVVVGATANIDINPDNADVILLLTDAAGNAIRADEIGETVTLMAVTAVNWVVWGAEKGTWTDVD